MILLFSLLSLWVFLIVAYYVVFKLEFIFNPECYFLRKESIRKTRKIPNGLYQLLIPIALILTLIVFTFIAFEIKKHQTPPKKWPFWQFLDQYGL